MSRAGATLSLLAWLVPAAAQAGCAEERDAGLAALARAGTVIEAPGELTEAGGECAVAGMVLGFDGPVSAAIGTVAWRISGMPDGPYRLALRVGGARLAPRVPDPWLSYMLDIQNRRNLVDLAARIDWDPQAGRIEVSDARIDLPGGSRVELALSARGLPAAGDDPPWSAGRTIGPGELRLAVENRGWFDGMLASVVVGALSGRPGAPEAVVAAAIADLRAEVAALPEDLIDPASKAALDALIADGPAPHGMVELSVNLPAPVLIDRLARQALDPQSLRAENFAARFGGARIGVAYTSAAPGR